MSTKRDISSEIEELSGFRSLVRAYEEIASLRMKKTRDSVVKNRNFMGEIEDIFEKVRASYAREVNKLAMKNKQKGNEAITFLAHNGKTVAVLISANSGLYGEIINETFDMFVEEIKKGKSEVTIVGSHGLSLFQSEFPDAPYTFFEISDEKIASADLDDLIKHIVQYEEIHVFYGKFVNVVKQVPDSIAISAQISLEEGESDTVSYIFEPSLEKILIFFETQIFGARMEQTVRESQLAKFASRVMAMDRADENIKVRVEKLNFENLKITHRNINRKQINSLASMNMW